MLLVHQWLLAELNLHLEQVLLTDSHQFRRLHFIELAHVDILEEPLIRLILLVDDLDLLVHLELRLDCRLNGLQE